MSRTPQVFGWSLAGVLGLSVALAVVQAQDSGGADEGQSANPKHDLSEIMKIAHTAPEGEKSLRDRVLAGKAKPEEVHELLDLYISLAENEPPQGDAEAWQDKTAAIVLAAAKVDVGRKEGLEQLGKATACAACHKEHKPPQ